MRELAHSNARRLPQQTRFAGLCRGAFARLRQASYRSASSGFSSVNRFAGFPEEPDVITTLPQQTRFAGLCRGPHFRGFHPPFARSTHTTIFPEVTL